MSYSISQNIKFDPSNMSAFGTLESSELTGALQIDFVYGINTQTGNSTVLNSATVDTINSMLRLQSGTNSAGSAIFNSKRAVKYRAGQGITARFTSIFGTGTASNTQIIGAGNATDGYFFGYNGTSYGIMTRNNGSDTWTAQASWNGDKADGTGLSGFTINPQKGNVYMIKYPFLGFGDVQFFVEDSNSGRFILVHTFKYANNYTVPQVTNPNLFFYAQTLNAGSTTNITMYSGSVGFFLSGVRSFMSSPKWAFDAFKVNVTNETSLFGLRNATTYNTVTNRSLIRLNTISLSTPTSATSIFGRIRIGATVGGSPTYVPISGSTADSGVTITSGNSIASVDTAGTTASGGLLEFSMNTCSNSGITYDLQDYNLYVMPGETLTFSVSAVPAAANVAGSLTWFEDI